MRAPSRTRSAPHDHRRTPERFIRRAPPPVPVAAWINKPDCEEAAH